MINIGIMSPYFRSHLCKLSYQHFTATVTCIAHILTVTCTTNQHIGSGNIPAHIPQSITDQFGYMQCTGVVNIYSSRGNSEETISVFETKNMPVSPIAQSTILGQAISTNPRTRKDDIAVCGLIFMVITFMRSTPLRSAKIPFVEECRIVACKNFNNLVVSDSIMIQDCEGEFLGIKHLMKEFLDSASGFIIASTHSPDLFGNIFFPSIIVQAVCQKRLV